MECDKNSVIVPIQSRQLRRYTTNSTGFKSFFASNASSLSSSFISCADDDSCQRCPTQEDDDDDEVVSLCDSEATSFYDSDEDDCCRPGGDDDYYEVVSPATTKSSSSSSPPSPRSSTIMTANRIGKTSSNSTSAPMIIFRGAVETWEAFMNGRFTLTTCIDCSHSMVSVDDAAWVVCANCRVVYPLIRDVTNTTSSSGSTTARKEPATQYGIGMGFHPTWCMTLLQEERMRGDTSSLTQKAVQSSIDTGDAFNLR